MKTLDMPQTGQPGLTARPIMVRPSDHTSPPIPPGITHPGRSSAPKRRIPALRPSDLQLHHQLINDGRLKSGRMGAFVYYVWAGQQHWRRHSVPQDPRTPAQRRSRARFGAASRTWSTNGPLTEKQRDAWRAEGTKTRSRPRLGTSGKLTGQQAFVARNCARAQPEHSMLLDPHQALRAHAFNPQLVGGPSYTRPYLSPKTTVVCATLEANLFHGATPPRLPGDAQFVGGPSYTRPYLSPKTTVVCAILEANLSHGATPPKLPGDPQFVGGPSYTRPYLSPKTTVVCAILEANLSHGATPPRLPGDAQFVGGPSYTRPCLSPKTTMVCATLEAHPSHGTTRPRPLHDEKNEDAALVHYSARRVEVIQLKSVTQATSEQYRTYTLAPPKQRRWQTRDPSPLADLRRACRRRSYPKSIAMGWSSHHFRGGFAG